MRRVVVAGGETSGAVVGALDVRTVVVTAEEDRGVPWCVTAGEPRLGLLLKSGNFGAPDLFNFETMASLGLLLVSLYLAGVGSGPRAGAGTGSGRRFYGRRPGRG